MEIRARFYNNVAIMSPYGRFDSLAANSFEEAALAHLGNGYHRFVLDMQGVEFLNSAAIRSIISVAKRSREAGGDIRLASVRPTVKYVLNLTGVERVVRIFPNVVAATASYFPGPMVDQR